METSALTEALRAREASEAAARAEAEKARAALADLDEEAARMRHERAGIRAANARMQSLLERLRGKITLPNGSVDPSFGLDLAADADPAAAAYTATPSGGASGGGGATTYPYAQEDYATASHRPMPLDSDAADSSRVPLHMHSRPSHLAAATAPGAPTPDERSHRSRPLNPARPRVAAPHTDAHAPPPVHTPRQALTPSQRMAERREGAAHQPALAAPPPPSRSAPTTPRAVHPAQPTPAAAGQTARGCRSVARGRGGTCVTGRGSGASGVGSDRLLRPGVGTIMAGGTRRGAGTPSNGEASAGESGRARCITPRQLATPATQPIPSAGFEAAPAVGCCPASPGAALATGHASLPTAPPPPVAERRTAALVLRLASIRAWLQRCTGVDLPPGDLPSLLEDGQLLLTLVDAAMPGVAKPVEGQPARARLGAFSSACRQLGVQADDVLPVEAWLAGPQRSAEAICAALTALAEEAASRGLLPPLGGQ